MNATESKSEENSIMGNIGDKKRNDDKMESEIKLANKKVTNAAGSPKREESLCEGSSTRKLLKCGSGVDEVKSGEEEFKSGEKEVKSGEVEVKSGEGEEDQDTVGKANLQEGDRDPQPKVAEEPPDTEDEEADSPMKTDNDDLAASDGDEEIARRGLGSSVRKVWGRESFSPVREVWGEEGFNERDDEEEAEQEEEQEVDNNEVENQNEGSVAENEGRSIGKRNLQK